MPDPSRIMKRHDTADPITGRVSAPGGPNGGTVDLTTFGTVKFQAKTATGGVIGGTVTSKNADGTWTYQQVDADVSTAGIYGCEIECTLANGRKVHFPNEAADNPVLQIDTDLDNL